jgi:hypothetical protein
MLKLAVIGSLVAVGIYLASLHIPATYSLYIVGPGLDESDCPSDTIRYEIDSAGVGCSYVPPSPDPVLSPETLPMQP